MAELNKKLQLQSEQSTKSIDFDFFDLSLIDKYSPFLQKKQETHSETDIFDFYHFQKHQFFAIPQEHEQQEKEIHQRFVIKEIKPEINESLLDSTNFLIPAQQHQENPEKLQLIKLQSNNPHTIHQCQICIESFDNKDIQKAFECSHQFCQTCLTDHILNKLSTFSEITCPELGCKQHLNQASECYKNLTPQKKRKYQKIQRLNFVNSDPHFKLCPIENCEGVLLYNKGETTFCVTCGLIFCQNCLNPLHDGECETNEVMLLEKNLQYKRCSKCRHVLERTQGCNHMTCVCKYEFCYVCGQQWSGNHMSCKQGQKNELLERERETQIRRRQEMEAMRQEMEARQQLQKKNQRMRELYGTEQDTNMEELLRISQATYFQQLRMQEQLQEETSLAMAINMSMMELKEEKMWEDELYFEQIEFIDQKKHEEENKCNEGYVYFEEKGGDLEKEQMDYSGDDQDYI